VLQNVFWAEIEEKTMTRILNDFLLTNAFVYITIYSIYTDSGDSNTRR